MIAWVRIRGLGVLDDVDVTFGPGFNVITGESGAGKTMILRGVGLLLGAKADPGLIREGHDRIEVEGAVDLKDPGLRARVRERLTDAGVDLADDEPVMIARTIAREGGRSRTVIQGRTVPASLLAEIAQDLAAVHGQGDQLRLLQAGRQRDALDGFAGPAVAGLLGDYRALWSRWQAVTRSLTDVVAHARDRAREADVLRFGIDEIEAVAPEPGEDDLLAGEAARLGHAQTLRELAGAAHDALSADSSGYDVDALTLLGGSEAAAAKAASIDPTLGPLVARLREVRLSADDVAAELATYAASIEADPQRLATVEERRAALAGLRRKYGETVADVLAWLAQARTRLADLDGDEDTVVRLERERDEARAGLEALAARISAERSRAAGRLAEEVTAELTQLAMPRARLVVEITSRDDLGPHGSDDIDFLLAAHADAPLRPVARAASGGELSRVMLALEVALVGADVVPTMVFDEVDAGVGGDAARALAGRLAVVATTSQLLVVTHLAQVAASADHHLALRSAGDRIDAVEALDGDARVREVARMLSGTADSTVSLEHARELLASAARPSRPNGRDC